MRDSITKLALLFAGCIAAAGGFAVDIQGGTESIALVGNEITDTCEGGRPAEIRFETTSVDRTALGGKATRKEITIHFTAYDWAQFLDFADRHWK